MEWIELKDLSKSQIVEKRYLFEKQLMEQTQFSTTNRLGKEDKEGCFGLKPT